MGFRSWLDALLNGKKADQNHHIMEAPPPSDPWEEEAAGLNFSTAIAAHQAWKVRLQAVIDDQSSENLSINVVSRDDQCILGKWILDRGAHEQRQGRGGLGTKVLRT